MLVKDLMDPSILMVHEDTKLLEAIHLMRDSGISMFAVVNSDTALRGVVYTEDLLRVMFLSQGEKYGKTFREYELMEGNADRYADIPVKDIMRVRYVSTNPYEPVLRASSLMLQNHLPVLPVMDLRGHALGVVTQSVILREMIRQQAMGSEMKMRTEFKEEPRSAAPRLKSLGLETEGKERRKFVRVGCELDVLFQYADPKNTPLGFEGKSPCRGINVSAGGMALSVTKFLENGTLLHLDFPIGDGTAVRALAKVVRWDRQKDSNIYMTGVQFLALTSDDRQEIERFVRTQRFQPEQKNWSSLN